MVRFSTNISSALPVVSRLTVRCSQTVETKALISGSNDGSENRGGCDDCCPEKNKKHQRRSKINGFKLRIEGESQEIRGSEPQLRVKLVKF